MARNVTKAPMRHHDHGSWRRGSSFITATMARYRRVAAWLLLSVPVVFMAILPTLWFRAHRSAVYDALDNPLLSGARTVYVLGLAIPTAVAVMLLLGEPMVGKPVWRSTRIQRTDALALACWLVAQGMLQWARFVRFGLEPTMGSIKHVAITFGLAAAINFQLLLIPTSRSSPLLALLGVPSEQLIHWHKFLGISSAVLVGLHGFFFWIYWLSKGTLLEEALEWPLDHHVANAPGELALLAGAALCWFSRPSIRRRFYEWFLYVHYVGAAAIFLLAALHWHSFVWWTFPGVALYASDAASHAGVGKRRVQLLRARYSHGVLTLKLRYDAYLNRPQPLQWMLLAAPQVSALQWHPFSVSAAASSNGGAFHLSIRVVPGGWTDTLRLQLADAGHLNGKCDDGVTPPQPIVLHATGWYGLGFNFEPYDRGQPLLLVAGGSGGAPFAALLRALANRPASPAPITLVWVCRGNRQATEYVRTTALAQWATLLPTLAVHIHVTPDLDPVDDNEAEQPPYHTAGSAGNAFPSTYPSDHDPAAHHAGEALLASTAPTLAPPPQLALAALCHAFVPAGGVLGLKKGVIN